MISQIPNTSVTRGRRVIEHGLLPSPVRNRSGSALILTVALSVLLAMIAALFILRTSVDSVGTLALSDNKEMNYAVDTIVEQLSRELAWDVPGVRPESESYDYPWENAIPFTDPNWRSDDRWLASLEPYKNPNDNVYYWGHISDLYGDCGQSRTNDVSANVIVLDATTTSEFARADADGDGVNDAIWVRAMTDPDRNKVYLGTDKTPLKTSKNKQIYLALRVIDMGGMLNANTGYVFNSTDTTPTSKADGSSVMQVNLLGLSKRGTTGLDSLPNLQKKWLSVGTFDQTDYLDKVVWQLDSPRLSSSGKPYAPFDIGDELKLRYRYVVQMNDMTTRMDNNDDQFWRSVWEGGRRTPVADSAGYTDWTSRVDFSVNAANYDYDHITTTYNADRLIDPAGGPLINLNDPATTAQVIYDGLVKVDKARVANGKVSLAGGDLLPQLAVNIVACRNGNGSGASLSANSKVYYGHSRPFVWISELAFSQTSDMFGTYRCYGIEYYAPNTTGPSGTFRLQINGVTKDAFVLSSAWTSNYRVLLRNDPSSSQQLIPDPSAYVAPPSAVAFHEGEILTLEKLDSATGTWFVVDTVTVPATGWSAADTAAPISSQRDLVDATGSEDLHAMYRLWNGTLALPPTLGAANLYTYPTPIAPMQYDVPGGDFVTLGDAGSVFRYATNDLAWYSPTAPWFSSLEEADADVRFNWSSSADMDEFAEFFTVMSQPHSAEKERIYGRLNINTAPAFVLAQLPWVSDRQKMIIDPTDPAKLIASPWSSPRLAEAIVAYRDKHAITGGPDYRNRASATEITGLRQSLGFASIAELNHVITGPTARTATPAITEYGIDWYATNMDPRDTTKPLDESLMPDLTPSDKSANDVEERDLIFSRISNLVTVRSDVFCAYILVRLGEDGPQKRFIAILDRSGVAKTATAGQYTGRVKIRAFQPVPDPR
jgi:hypothetical protein